MDLKRILQKKNAKHNRLTANINYKKLKVNDVIKKFYRWDTKKRVDKPKRTISKWSPSY